MRKLNQLFFIIFFLVSVFVGLQISNSYPEVNALADCVCDDWKCDNVWYEEPGKSDYPGWHSICWCESSQCVSLECNPGSYVCNRDGQCCPIGTVDPTPTPGGGTPSPDPSDPPDPDPYCGDGTCNGGEDCFNCPGDCNVCCGDGSCNYGETCESCVSDCGACPPGPYCGDGTCDIDESCNSCFLDCGACPTCGDGSCNGFETCADCVSDCGACPATFAWWQVRGGTLASEASYGYAISSEVPDETTCIEPNCYPYLSATDMANTPDSDGIPIISGGEVSANGRVGVRGDDIYASDTTKTRLRETYSFFYSQYSLGLSPEDDYVGSEGDALKPGTTKDAYFHSGDMTIQSPWSVTTGESFVVFIDGDLTIEDPGAVGELITVDEGGFLAFIVSGDINIADSVGHSTLTNLTGNLEGVYIADGNLTINTNGALDNRFVGEGTFVGWNGVDMLRDFDESASNELYPTEMFVYRPDLVKNTPEKMKRSQMIWQETN